MTKSKAESASKAKPEPKAEPEPVQYVLMSGKHSRRNPDGKTSTVYRPGDIVPNLTPGELASFGDKFLTVDQFRERASSFDQGIETETDRAAAAIVAKKEAETAHDAPRDESAESRAAKINQMYEADQRETGRRIGR